MEKISEGRKKRYYPFIAVLNPEGIIESCIKESKSRRDDIGFIGYDTPSGSQGFLCKVTLLMKIMPNWRKIQFPRESFDPKQNGE